MVEHISGMRHMSEFSLPGTEPPRGSRQLSDLAGCPTGKVLQGFFEVGDPRWRPLGHFALNPQQIDSPRDGYSNPEAGDINSSHVRHVSCQRTLLSDVMCCHCRRPTGRGKPVGYRLGIDVGATTAVAVVFNDTGAVRAVPLGREAVVPATVL